MRYTNIDKLKETLKHPPLCHALGGMSMQDVFDIIDESSTDDVTETIHAHWNSYNSDNPKWLRDDGKTIFMECSNCKTTQARAFLNHSKYCPNCGAKMTTEFER